MPQVFIPFNKMDFRQGGSPGGDLWYVKDAIKKETGYTVFNGWNRTYHNISWGETDNILWGVGQYYNDVAGTAVTKTYAGGRNNIYTFDGGVVAARGRPSVAPGPAGFNYNTNTGGTGWFFSQFGPYMFAVNGVDNIQISEPGSSTPLNTYFNDLGVAPSVIPTNGANPTARYIIAHKNHIVIAYVTLAAAYGALAAAAYPYTWPNLVWWSGLDNGGAFGDSTVSPNIDGTGWQLIFDGSGPITGMIGGYDAAFVFKSGSVHRMDGPPFQINCISNSVGCVQPRSIVRLGERVYFWSTSGPAYIDTTNNSINFPDEGSVNDALVRSGLSDRLLVAPLSDSLNNGITPAYTGPYLYTPFAISAGVDADNRIIAWKYVTEIKSFSSAPTRSVPIILTYNERTDSYSVLNSEPLDGDPPLWALLVSSQTAKGGSDLLRIKQIYAEISTDGLSEYNVVGEYGNGTGRFRLPFIPFTDKPGTETKIERIRIRYRNGGYSYNPNWTPGEIQFGYHILTSSSPACFPYVTSAGTLPAQTSADGWIIADNTYFGSAHSIEVSTKCKDQGGTPLINTYDVIGHIQGIDVIYSTRGGRSA